MSSADSHVMSLVNAATLDGFTRRVTDTEGVSVQALDPLTTLVVETRNSVYRVIVSQRAEVLVQGGQFFPEPTPAHLSGSGFGGSMLKVGWIGVGLRMEMSAGEHRIITSPVRKITTECDAPRTH